MATDIKIYCKNLETEISVNGGESLLEIYARLSQRIGVDAICATVNNQVRSLHFRVYSPVQVEFLDAGSRLGDRVYLLSLCMLAIKRNMVYSVKGNYRIHPNVSKFKPILNMHHIQ